MNISISWTITVIYILLIASKIDMSVGKSVPQLEPIDLSEYGTRLFGKPDKDVGLKVGNWKDNQESGNPEELGSYFEGDILFPSGQSRNGLIAETYRWRDGIVPFEIRGDYDAFEMDLIEKAINAYHDNTCIKFVPKKSSDEDYISIQSSSSGCWSSVGRVGGRQVVNLQKNGCLTKVGTVIHELMHACGFTHEQNRDERDDYVEIRFQNVKTGYENNFEKAKKGTTDSFGKSYDYNSVMHYSDHAFSANGQPTIVNKKKFDGQMGQRDGFSKVDIEKLRKMYKCTSTTSESGYKPQISISQAVVSGGIEDILSMIIPTSDDKLQPSKSSNKRKSIRMR